MDRHNCRIGRSDVHRYLPADPAAHLPGADGSGLWPCGVCRGQPCLPPVGLAARPAGDHVQRRRGAVRRLRRVDPLAARRNEAGRPLRRDSGRDLPVVVPRIWTAAGRDAVLRMGRATDCAAPMDAHRTGRGIHGAGTFMARFPRVCPGTPTTSSRSRCGWVSSTPTNRFRQMLSVSNSPRPSRSTCPREVASDCRAGCSAAIRSSS